MMITTMMMMNFRRGIKFLDEFIALGHLLFHLLMCSFSSFSLDLSIAMRSDLILTLLIKRGFGFHNTTIKGQRSFKSLKMRQNSTIKSSVASMNFSKWISKHRKERRKLIEKFNKKFGSIWIKTINMSNGSAIDCCQKIPRIECIISL